MIKMDADYDIIERLIRNISHEIKNPLTTIRGYAQLLGMKPDEPEFAEKSRKMVIDNVDLIDERINLLYGVFDLEPGVPEKTDIGHLLTSFMASLDASIKNKVSLRAPGGLREVLADPMQLSAALHAIAGGFDWINNPQTDLVLTAENEDSREGVNVFMLFSGIDFSVLGEKSFFLPFPDRKYFRRGIELFEVYAMSRNNGWRFGLAARDGRQGVVLGI